MTENKILGASSPYVPDLVLELFASSQLVATEGTFRTKIHIIGHDKGGLVTTLPEKEWLRGHVLLALRTVIMMAMPKALIVSQHNLFPGNSLESWAIANGDAAGVRYTYANEPMFHVLKSDTLDKVAAAPPVVRHLMPLTKQGRVSDLSDFGAMLTHVIDVFGIDGKCPPTLYGDFDLLGAIGVGKQRGEKIA